MKKIRLLLAVVLASVCSIQTMWAERTAPVFPEAMTLESGGTYYLYNPGSGRFLYLDGSTVYAYSSSRSALVITNVEGDVYTFNVEGTSYYLYSTSSNSSQMRASTSTSSSYISYRQFRIEQTDGGYTIQRNYDYNETYYVGNATGNSSIYSNFTSGNIVWQLYDADGADAIIRYRAKKALYDALVSADDYSLSFAFQEYEELYANDETTNSELYAAANTINNALSWTDILASRYSEYPIYTELTGSATWTTNNSGKYSGTTIKNGEGGLKATLEVDQDATLVYSYHLAQSWTGYSFNVYLDGELYQTINNEEGYNDGNANTYYYFVELTPGRHVIEWKAKSTSESTSTTFYLSGIAAYNTPTVTITVTQPGSLGTEILYKVDHVKEVRKLVVKGGDLNSEDWERINMMTSLFDLDLTETAVTTLPSIHPGSYFHKLKLPQGLTTIEASALSSRPLEELTFPATLQTIGESALRYTRITKAILPETVTSIGSYAFADNQSLLEVYLPESVSSVGTYAFYNDYNLEKATWPSQVKTVPSYCFYSNYNLTTLTLPEGITAIDPYAFMNCYKCDFQLPSTISFIGGYAFKEADMIESLYIPDNCTLGKNAFENCSKLKYVKLGEGVSIDYTSYYNTTNNYYEYRCWTFQDCTALEEIEFPTSFYTIPYTYMIKGCTALKKVTFKSPTLIGGNSYSSFFSGLGTNIQVYVPSYLVNAYKLDKYWYNYNIMGFSTADITDWTIRKELTFYSQDRFEGTPNVKIYNKGSWTINGEAEQRIGNFHTYCFSQENGGGISGCSEIISNCDNVSINGSYTYDYYAYNTYRRLNYDGSVGSATYYGRWHFLCIPFDFKVSEITTSNDALFAIRYYDGANRAANGTGGNWKDYSADDVIPAGTGFIIQANKETRFYFHSLDNASKQNVISNKTFVKALEANDSEQSSNKGWNFVGNPWLCYYNIHKLNFTGAITVYNSFIKTYSAISIIDDDYAIRPGQAFFVQCPDEVSEISFPVDGRQLTSVIESQNGVKAQTPQVQTRWLVDVELSDGEQSDKTRFVLNEEASMDYETSCDASKFFEAESTCPQLYTIEDGEALAINERPMADGIILLGFIVAQSGSYTISAPRNQFQHIWLYDREKDKEVDLAVEHYTFTADAGTDEARFELRLNNSSVVTAIDEMNINEYGKTKQVYTLDGRQIDTPLQRGIYIVNGKKVVVK